jgi:NAD(P)-dependent dehydrogenase (short-subunit alcohol dehydrogenase family)
MFDLTGRTALITGGGYGLGRAFARALAGQGATIICADIDGVRAAETVGLIQEAGGQAVSIKVDVASEQSVDEMAAKVRNVTDKLHVLINNAGVASLPARVLDIPVAEWDRVVSVNLRGVFLCTRALLPLLVAAKSSSVINLSSYLGLLGAYPGYPVTAAQYAATKAGVIGFTRQLAVEYAKEGLRSNAIAPGWHFGTDLGKARRETATADEMNAFMDFAKSTIPQGRVGAPEDLAGLVVYLASDASSYMTGQVFAHDGGITAA